MGYYVRTLDNASQFFMGKEHFDAAYKDMCLLNQLDEMKRGGSWSKDGVSARDPRPEGMNYHPARWFSWMNADYPSQLKTAPEILQELGFHLSFDSDGNINGLSYDDKTGQEELFLGAIAPYVQDGSRIVWMGEDGAIWVNDFGGNGEMLTQEVSLNNAIRNILDESMTTAVIKDALQEL